MVFVRGIVQDVGFRPFVHELARRFDLNGCVRNQSGQVLIEIKGDDAPLDGFVNELITRPLPLARIDKETWHSQAAISERTFSLEPSEETAADAIFIPPDFATCDECLAEWFDPKVSFFQVIAITITELIALKE